MLTAQLVRGGGPEVLELVTINVPFPEDNQLIVKVEAAAINPSDIIQRKIKFGKFPRGTGSDFAGRVAAIGKNVKDYKIGDRVWGSLGTSMHKIGSVSQYIVATEDQIARSPENISSISLAALPLAGITAYQALRERAKLKKGEKLLLIGASGGVGHIALQLAVSMGANVTLV